MTRAKKSRRLVRQLLFFLKPCWESPIRLLPSRCVIILPLINLSIVLQTTDVRLIGLSFPGSCLFLFLWIAVTLEAFQSAGIIPVSAHLLKMWFRGPHSMSSRVHRTLGCRRWGPVDLYTLRWFSFPCTSASLKSNVSSVLPTYLGSCGILFSCSWVNTELKYVLRVLAMSLSVVTSWPVGVLSGPTLSLTILLSLM